MVKKRAPRARGRPQGGSEALVRTILETTLKQLEERGFSGISVEEIARVAGVNKTSVYRRWPSKAELVLAATRAVRPAQPVFVPRGDLRRDLVRLLEAKVATLASPQGQRVAHAILALEGDDREELSQALRGQRDRKLREMLEAAIERRELPADTDVPFVAELLVGALWNRLFIRGVSCPLAYIRKVVEHILVGAGYATPPKRRVPRTQ